MVLNLKCIRDTLLALERCLVLNDELEFVGQNLDELRKSGELLQYSRSDLAYTLVLLTEADFIESYIDYADDVIEELTVIRLTYSFSTLSVLTHSGKKYILSPKLPV